MVYGLIIAAGSQKRFQTDIPKALVKIKSGEQWQATKRREKT